MRTFLQVQEDIITQLKEDSINPEFWSRQEVKDAINDAYWFIADETHCFRLEHIIEIKAGIRTYKLPENYIHGSLNRVEFNNKIIYPVTSMELDTYSRSWRDTEGSDITHYIPPGDLSNTDEIMVYPKPDTDGAVYNEASESQDYGVITTVGDDSYEEFVTEEGVIVSTEGESKFIQDDGAVLDIYDPTGNLKIFAAKYPKRLYSDTETFLHPLTYNPRRILVLGSMAVLLAKEGEGKDISKASFYNKRFAEVLSKLFQKPKVKRMHRVRSITEGSIGNYGEMGRLNLGEHYPSYVK